MTPHPRDLDRRGFLQAMLGAATLLGLGACAKGDEGDTASATPAASDPLPTAVPAGTKLSIASAAGSQQLQLQLAGLDADLPFEISDWPNVAAGPDVINAFRANSLDLGFNAGIPPIQAHYQDFDARIVAVGYHRKPIYVFSTRPGSDIRTVDDFRGARLAFSQGQAQGVVFLRALDEAGIDQADVELVPLTSNQFLTALQAGQVDVAPLGLAQSAQYLAQYGGDGARSIETDVVDLLAVLWAPSSVLADEAKVAAIAAYIPLWAQASVWAYENPERWAQDYYVATQSVTAEDAREIVELTPKPEFPPTWDDAVAWEQETVDLLAEGGFVEPFAAEVLFDRRFEPLAAGAVGADYSDTDNEYRA
jgi:sulfonate transport system substrate-binding protein